MSFDDDESTLAGRILGAAFCAAGVVGLLLLGCYAFRDVIAAAVRP